MTHQKPEPAADILFQSPDLIVRRGTLFPGKVCFVTFSSFTYERTLSRPGFGETFLASRSLSAIHVISRNNAWFDYPQMTEALAIVANAVAGFDRVITYGSSMGGYGAIRFADQLGAQVAIAISPQYGVGGPSAAFEDRFRRDGPAARVMGPWHGSTVVRPVVFFDPRDLDALHFRRIKRHYPQAEAVAIAHAGHPAGAYLDESGLLTGGIVDLAEGRFDALAFATEARRRRRRSGQYLFTLARRLGPTHMRGKIALIQMAIAVRDDATYRIYLATLLEMSGQIDAAEKHLCVAGEMLPDHPVVLYAWASFLLRRRRLAEAHATICDLLKRAPENHRFSELLTVVKAMAEPSWRRWWSPDVHQALASYRAARLAFKAWLVMLIVLTRLHATPLGRAPLPRWHERYFNLSRELQLVDEWKRRRRRCRKLARLRW